MPTPIGKLVTDALAASGLSQHGFCREVGYDQGSLQGVIKGQRKPPLGSEEAWAKALGLKGEARHDFLVAYWLAHAPPQLATRSTGSVTRVDDTDVFEGVLDGSLDVRRGCRQLPPRSGR